MKYFIVLTFLIFSASKIFCENFIYENSKLNFMVKNYSIPEGLPQNSVSGIVQSKDGFIWISTFGGLAKFDGYKFELITNTNYPELLSNRISKISIDKEDVLWILDEIGHLYCFKNNHLTLDSAFLKTDFFPAYRMEIDSSGTLWFVTSKGIVNFKDKIYKLVVKNEVYDNKLVSGIKGHTNGLYLFADNQVYNVTDEGIKLIYENNYYGFVSSEVLDNDEVILGAYETLIKKESGTIKIFDLFQFEPGLITSIKRDSKNIVWVGSENSKIFQIDSNKVTPLDIFGENLGHINIIFEDNQNNIWIGTNNKGLIQVAYPKLKVFNQYNDIILNNTMPLLKRENGEIWVGTPCNGIKIFNSAGIKEIECTQRSITNCCIWTLFEDSKKRVWLGTYGQYLYLYEDDDFINISANKGFQAGSFFSINEDEKGRILIGSSKGLYVIENNNFKLYNVNDGLPSNLIRSVFRDVDNKIWLSTSNGIVLFDGINFHPIFSDMDSRTIYQDSKKRLWFGSYGQGLRVLDGNMKYEITENDGIFSNIISAIVEDDIGNFWFTSNTGLFKIQTTMIDSFLNKQIKELTSTVFTETDGLNNSEFNGGFTPSYMKDENGFLYFPTLEGLAIINPNEVLKEKYIPNAIIEELKTEGRILDLDSLIVPYDYKYIEIQYTGIDFSNNNQLHFRYKINGLMNSWSSPTKNRSVTLTNLEGGNYSFELQVSNNLTEWSKSKVIHFIIKVPFYDVPLFRISLTVIVILVLLTIVYLRIYYLKKNEIKLKNLIEDKTNKLKSEKETTERLLEKTRIAEKEAVENKKIIEKAYEQKTELIEDVTHKLKNPLSAIRGASELLIEDSQNKNNEVFELSNLIFRSANDLIYALKMMIEDSFLDAKGLKLEKSNIGNILKSAVENNYIQANSKNINILTDIEENTFCYVDEEKIYTAFENLISNAIKYSPNGKNVFIKLIKETERILVKIKDEGLGFSEEDKALLYKRFQKLSSKPTGDESSTGLGLSIVKKILDMHHADIELNSIKNLGSEFIITFKKK